MRVYEGRFGRFLFFNRVLIRFRLENDEKSENPRRPFL